MSKLAKGIFLACVAIGIGAAVGGIAWVLTSREPSATQITSPAPTSNRPPAPTSPTKSSKAEAETESPIGGPIAFFYQYVGEMKNRVGENAVRAGSSTDGLTVASYGTDILSWLSDQSSTTITYGDPVFSRLSNGRWAMTSWSAPDDPRGGNILLYHEADCPTVDDDAVIAIVPSDDAGCQPTPTLTGGKSSQVFAADGSNYLFHMIMGNVYLSRLSDASSDITDLSEICVRSTAATSLSDLDVGESTIVLNQKTTGLLMSDTAIARRTDGTWVLFVKGIEPDNGCTQNSVCELCARAIYRTTSADLIHWSDVEKIVSGASVPEATTMPDGNIWLYYQNFEKVCETEDQHFGSTAPISAVYEQAGTYEFSEPKNASFPDESFEINTQVHYATNANPILLPDEATLEELDACFK